MIWKIYTLCICIVHFTRRILNCNKIFAEIVVLQTSDKRVLAVWILATRYQREMSTCFPGPFRLVLCT